MEPTANFESLPIVWQQVGSGVIFILVTVVAAIGWIKKHNPFADKEPKPKDAVVLSAAIADSMAIHRLALAIEALIADNGKGTAALEGIENCLKNIYEEQERTNRLLKDLI